MLVSGASNHRGLKTLQLLQGRVEDLFESYRGD
jgi:hypothetical protein